MSSLWVKVQTTIVDNPKIIGLSDKGFRTFIEMMIYSQQHLSDGFIDGRVARSKWGEEVLNELMSNDKNNPSLVAVEDGYLLYNYTKYQTSASKVEEIRERAKKAGKQSAAKRGAQRNVEQVVEHTVEQRVQPDTEVEEEVEIDKEHMFNGVERVSSYSDDFEAWWNAYPRKQGKGKAWEAWLKSINKLNPDLLIAAANDYYLSDLPKDPKFIPLPATWLNQERWNDELAKPVAVVDPNDWMIAKKIELS